MNQCKWTVICSHISLKLWILTSSSCLKSTEFGDWCSLVFKVHNQSWDPEALSLKWTWQLCLWPAIHQLCLVQFWSVARTCSKNTPLLQPPHWDSYKVFMRQKTTDEWRFTKQDETKGWELLLQRFSFLFRCKMPDCRLPPHLSTLTPVYSHTCSSHRCTLLMVKFLFRKLCELQWEGKSLVRFSLLSTSLLVSKTAAIFAFSLVTKQFAKSHRVLLVACWTKPSTSDRWL